LKLLTERSIAPFAMTTVFLSRIAALPRTIVTPAFFRLRLYAFSKRSGLCAKGFAKAAADCLAAFEMWSRQSRSSRTIDAYRQKFENHLAQWRESPPQRRVADASVRHDAELLATERIF
jgi:hypothetical protein